MMEAASREMTLKEVAKQYGDFHRAAKEYVRIAHAIRMLDQCSWWEFWRKRNIRKILIETIREIEATR